MPGQTTERAFETYDEEILRPRDSWKFWKTSFPNPKTGFPELKSGFQDPEPSMRAASAPQSGVTAIAAGSYQHRGTRPHKSPIVSLFSRQAQSR